MIRRLRINLPATSLLCLLSFTQALTACDDADDAATGESGASAQDVGGTTSGGGAETGIVITTAAGSGGTSGDNSGTGGGSGGSGGGTTTDGNDDMADDSDGETPHGSFAVITQVFTAEESISYIIHTTSFSGGVVLDLGSAIEHPGRALGSGPGLLSLFVGGNDSGKLDHYRINAHGQLQLGQSLSFINQGIQVIGEYQGQFQYSNDGRGFFFDGHTGQVVSFDIASTTVRGSTRLGGALYPREIATFGPEPLVMGAKVYYPMGWRGDDNVSIPSRAGMLVYDAATEQGHVVTDDRCGYLRDGVFGPDGFIYLATEAFGSAVHRIAPANAPAPCMLRFDPALNRFDPNFYVRLSDLVGGVTAGSIIVGSEGQPFLRVLDERLTQVANDSHPRALASAPAWTWWALTVGDQPSASLVEAMPATGGSALAFYAGGRRYYPNFAADFSTTQFMSLADADLGNVSATAPGLVFSVVDL